MGRYSKAYFEVFIISIIVMWLPIKVFAYAVPFIVLFWFSIRSNSGVTLLRFFLWIFVYFILLAIYYLLYLVVGKEFILQNAILSFFTYSPIIFFISIPPKAILININIEKYIKVIKWVIVLESIIGIMQVLIWSCMYSTNFDTAVGDIVNGTLSVFSFIYPKGNFNNQIFEFNLLFLMIFFFPYCIYYKKDYWVCTLGLVAILLASVWHLFLSLVLSIVFISLYFNSSFLRISKQRVFASFVIVMIFVMMNVIQPQNSQLVSFYFNKIMSGESPKTHATILSTTELPKNYPWVYVTGLGPGQYCSRAGLIGTGRYFGGFTHPTKMPILNAKSSDAFKQYIYPIWEEISLNPKYGDSTMARPFYSLLSVLIEFGYIFFMFIILLLIIFMMKCKKRYLYFLKEKSIFYSYIILVCTISVIFILVSSFFENYIEVPQAIFPGLILLRYFYSYTSLPTPVINN